MLIEEGLTFGRWTVIGEGIHYKGNNPYIECRCECGREYDVRTASLRNGTSTRCKLCKQREHGAKLRKPDAGWNTWYYRYQSNAKNRSLPFELGKEDFIEICIRDCDYCGAEPMDTQTAISQLIVTNGIDRIDSAYGYTPENCVACCTVCNRMKMALGREKFLEQVEQIYKHQLKKDR